LTINRKSNKIDLILKYHIAYNRRQTLEGYHGTTPQSVNAILETKHFKINKFEITGDWIIKNNQSLPNDLGQGLYLFVDDEDKGYQGLESAKSYDRIYRNSKKKIGVIKFKVDRENLKVLNLNSPASIKIFNKYKETYSSRISNSLKHLKQNRALDRYNLDGIFIEHLLCYHHKFKDVNAVSYDSYVPRTPDRPMSGVPNGREVCLRNSDLIDWSLTEEVYNGL